MPKRSKPWWSPPDRLNERSARVLGILACIQVIDGYLGSVITQTITFAADEFDYSSSQQGITLAVIRVGILISLGQYFEAQIQEKPKAAAIMNGKRSLK